MKYINFDNISRVLVQCDERELSFITKMFNAIKTEEFYTAMASATESMATYEKIKDLTTCMSEYHGDNELSVGATEFYDNLSLLLKIFSGEEIPASAKSLGHLFFFEDDAKKEEYIVLKKGALLIKDVVCRNKILLRLVKNEYMTISDYCLFLSKWAVHELNFDQRRVVPLLLNNLDADVEKFVKVQQNPDLFNKVFQEINRMLTLLQRHEPTLVNNFRARYDIYPSHYYRQNKYSLLSNGEFILQETSRPKIVTEKDSKIAKLTGENKRISREKDVIAKNTVFLKNLVDSKEEEIKKLKEIIKEKDEEIKLLKQEKQDLIFSIENKIDPKTLHKSK